MQRYLWRILAKSWKNLSSVFTRVGVGLSLGSALNLNVYNVYIIKIDTRLVCESKICLLSIQNNNFKKNTHTWHDANIILHRLFTLYVPIHKHVIFLFSNCAKQLIKARIFTLRKFIIYVILFCYILVTLDAFELHVSTRNRVPLTRAPWSRRFRRICRTATGHTLAFIAEHTWQITMNLYPRYSTSNKWRLIRENGRDERIISKKEMYV